MSTELVFAPRAAIFVLFARSPVSVGLEGPPRGCVLVIEGHRRRHGGPFVGIAAASNLGPRFPFF